MPLNNPIITNKDITNTTNILAKYINNPVTKST